MNVNKLLFEKSNKRHLLDFHLEPLNGLVILIITVTISPIPFRIDLNFKLVTWHIIYCYEHFRSSYFVCNHLYEQIKNEH